MVRDANGATPVLAAPARAGDAPTPVPPAAASPVGHNLTQKRGRRRGRRWIDWATGLAEGAGDPVASLTVTASGASSAQSSG